MNATIAKNFEFSIDYRIGTSWGPAQYRLRVWPGKKEKPIVCFGDSMEDIVQKHRQVIISLEAELDCMLKSMQLQNCQVPCKIANGITLDRSLVDMKTVLKIGDYSVDLAIILTWLRLHCPSVLRNA